MTESQIEDLRQDAASGLNVADASVEGKRPLHRENNSLQSQSPAVRKSDSSVKTTDGKRASVRPSIPKSTDSNYPHFRPEVVEVSISILKPHRLQEFLYQEDADRDEADPELISSIKQWGILEPLIVASRGKVIVSGHRRWQAAKQLGLETVPVRYVTHQCYADLVALLCESNRHRLKTPGQQVREDHNLMNSEEQRRRWELDRAKKAEATERLNQK